MIQDLLSFVYIILISICCGVVIGFEREIHNKPAGLKTVTLVVLGSAIFTFISTNGFYNTDDSRVAAQIVSGIGFLGAGVILRSELKIIGLTTAATLWVAAAIGMLIGTGLVTYALLSSVFTFLLINILRLVENRVFAKYMKFDIAIFLKDQEELNFVRELVNDLQFTVEKMEIHKDNENIIFKAKLKSDLSIFFNNFVKELDRRNIKYSL
ncbi:MAG: MgtC/SapB family protein [bacterium]